MSENFATDVQAGEIEPEPAARTDSVETKTAFVSGPGFENLPVEYVVVDGVALWQGCIELGEAAEVERDAAASRSTPRNTAPNGVALAELAAAAPAGGPTDVEVAGVGLPKDSSFLWTNGRMPYVVADDLPNPDRVDDAIAHWEANTGMRFVERTAANAAKHPNYVEFVRNPNVNWSSSRIGMRGGRQLIRVSDAASVGTLIHEIGHAFGHLHEQSRSDRDDFVTINWQNITAGFESNFQKQPSMTDYFEYDYGSIMHYPTWAFSKNGQPTIVPKQAGVTIGQRTALSFGDRLANAKMYERYFKKGHSGVWRSGSGKYGLWVNATWPNFLQKHQAWSADGMRLTDLNVHHRYGQTRYSGVWRAGAGGHALVANVSWNTFLKRWQDLSRSGLRLVDMNVHNRNGQNRYTGVFQQGTGAYGLWANASWSSFLAKWKAWGKQGLRLIDINVHRVDGQTRYSGVWAQGSGGYGLWANVTWSSFINKWNQWNQQGLRLVDMNVHRVDGQNRYSGVFSPGGGGYYLWANVTWQSFLAKWQQLGANGQRLLDYEWPHTGTGPSYDTAGAAAAILPPAELDVVDLDPAGVGFVAGGEGSDSAVLAATVSGGSELVIVGGEDGNDDADEQPDSSRLEDPAHGGPVFDLEEAAEPSGEDEHGGLVLLDEAPAGTAAAAAVAENGELVTD